MKTDNVLRCLPGRLLIAVGLLLTTLFSVRAGYESTVLGDNPLAYFALDLTVDTNGTATDLSGNGNDSGYYNLSPAAGPTAYIPNAAYFAGSSVESFVDLSSGVNAGILNFGGLITMEAWVQSADTTQGPADILAKGYDSSLDYDELCLRANGGVNYYGGTYNGSTGGASASGGVQTTNWTYLVSTFDGTNWNLYVNGQAVGHGADTVGAINFPDPWAIGTGSADGFSRFFIGNICQVALYTNSLTPAQIISHYYSALFGVTSISNSPPLIVTQPQSQAVYPGSSVTFRVVAVSASAVTNQWLKNGLPIAGQTNASLALGNVLAGDAASYSVILGNLNGATNSAVANLSLLASGNSLQWTASGNNGVWDTDTSANWLDVSNLQQTIFNPGDQVLFDDTAGVPNTVTISGVVSPSGITVDSSTNDFIFSGSGNISGPGGLLKEGASTLTIISPASFTGPVTIGGGAIYAGDSSFAAVSAITITNSSTLDFGGSSYGSDQLVNVSGAGVGGEGALYNSDNDDPGEVLDIVLAGDATFGGSSRWDLTGGSISGPHNLTVNWSNSSGYGEWNSAVLAANVGTIELATGKLGIKSMGANFGNPAASFLVDSGTELDFWTGDPGYAKNFHVFTGGVFQILAGFTSFSGNLTLEDGANFNAYYGGGNQAMNGTVTLNGMAHFVLGDANFIFTNVFSGPGGFVWDAYNHELYLQASNTYAGPTVIGAGLTLGLAANGSISDSSLIFFGGSASTNVSLDVSGRSDDTLNLAVGQTLGGIGTIDGNLVVSPGATISPAGTNITLGMTEGSSGTGVIIAGNVTLNGATILKLNGSGVNDQIQSAGSITYGGTLNLANISASPLAAGNSFQLFSAAAYAGSFASISPATPGTGLAWDASQLNSEGLLNVVSASGSGLVISSVTFSDGNLIFSGAGGSPNASYVVFTTTNLAPANWMPLVTNSLDASGAFSLTNAISTSTPQLFYRIN